MSYPLQKRQEWATFLHSDVPEAWVLERTETGREALLNRIAEIVPPGVNLNPADSGWQNPALEPSARRRQAPAGRR
jgi:hypothetical protein